MSQFVVCTEALLMLAGEAALSGAEAITVDIDNDSSISLSVDDGSLGYSLGELHDLRKQPETIVQYRSDSFCTFPFSFQDFAYLYSGIENLLQYIQEESSSADPDKLPLLRQAQKDYQDLLDRLYEYGAERGVPLPQPK